MTAKKKAKVIQNDLMDSAHKIWLAGLGAFAMAEEEGGKIFKGLVEKGEGVETQGKAEVEKAKTTAMGTVAGMKTVAESYWDTLERTMDDQVTAVIHRMGIPTKGEIEVLTSKVEQLTVSVDKLRANQVAAAQKSAASKPAAKKTSTVKKPAAKKTATTKKPATATQTAAATKS